jgi:protein-tyrosine kinase
VLESDTEQKALMRNADDKRSMGKAAESDIEAALAHQPNGSGPRHASTRWPPELILSWPSSDPQLELYRGLQLQLMQRWFSLGNKSLVVVSADHDAAVSFFVANLALVFAQAGHRTLLIDANLRRPRQHTIFNLNDGYGLSDMLVERQANEHIVEPVALDRLHVLAAGTVPSDPYDLLAGPSFANLSRKLSSRFDITLLDVPAVSACADAMAVATQAGGALLVANKNQTRVADVVAVEKKLQNLGVSLAGSVLINL